MQCSISGARGAVAAPEWWNKLTQLTPCPLLPTGRDGQKSEPSGGVSQECLRRENKKPSAARRFPRANMSRLRSTIAKSRSEISRRLQCRKRYGPTPTPVQTLPRHPSEGQDPVRQTKSPPSGGAFRRNWTPACAGVTEIAISAASAFSARNYSRQGPDTSKPGCSACAGGTGHVITAPSRNSPARPRSPCRLCRRECACPLPGRLRCPGCGSSRSSAATSCPGFRWRRRRNR